MLNFNLRFFREKIDNFPKPVKFEIIEKERIIETQAPIYLEGDLEKVKKSPFGITLEQEFADFKSTTYTSGPFYKYQLEDLLILRNRIYFNDYEYLLNPLEKPIRAYDSRDVVEYSQAAFSSMRISTVFFGHWLHEELMLIDYIQDKQNIVTSSPITPQKKEITELFDLKVNFNPYAKISYADMYDGWQHSSMFIETLKKYKEKISLLSNDKNIVSGPKAVYLKRGQSGVRRELENESELLNLMSKTFEITSFVAEATPIEELYEAIYRADIILGVEGSQLAHGIIAGKPGAILVCIQPPYRFYNPFKNYCNDAGILYAIFVADQPSESHSFRIDIDRFGLLLDKIENHV